jgi:hypothetical protein
MKDLWETHGNRQENPNGDQKTTEGRTGGMADYWETSGGRQKRADTGEYIKAPHHHALTVITGRAGPSLVTEGWVDDRPCLVTVDTGAYVTVAKPDIATGWPERQPN